MPRARPIAASPGPIVRIRMVRVLHPWPVRSDPAPPRDWRGRAGPGMGQTRPRIPGETRTAPTDRPHPVGMGRENPIPDRHRRRQDGAMARTVLVVDDHAAFRGRARAMLEADGFV